MKVVGVILAAIGALASVAAAVVAAWMGFVSGGFTTPALEVGFGMTKIQTSGDLRATGLKNDGPVTYLIYVTESSSDLPTEFVVPFYVYNRGTKALHDIIFRLTYPKRARSTSHELRLEKVGEKFTLNPDYTRMRSTSENGETVTSEFTIPLLRPGEGLGFGEMLLLNDRRNAVAPSTRSQLVTSLPFSGRLKEQVDLVDLVRITAFAAAGEDGPHTPQLTLVWVVGQNTVTALDAIADRIAAAAWGSYRPSPGHHFKWPWQSNPATTEFAEIAMTSILKGTDATDGVAIGIQDFDHERLAAASIVLPSWDYWAPIN